MDDLSDVGKNLQRFRIAVAAHDRNEPTHEPAHGIGMTGFDLERLGFDDGEELWAGIRIEAIENVTAGNFRVLCESEGIEEPAAEVVDAIAREDVHA